MALSLTGSSGRKTTNKGAHIVRMALESIQTGKRETPYKILLYSQEGLGKTSFASKAPDPIFIDVESGTDELDVARFPKPESFADVMEALRILATTSHPYKTVVLDTADALEPLIFADVIASNGKPDVKSIEDVGGGYGRGYVAALERWRVLLAALDALHVKGMNVIVLAHTGVKNFKSPEVALDAYDRYELKISGKGASALLKEWPKAVLFGKYDVATTEKDGRTKGVSTGRRVIKTTHSAAWDAKNRYGLPEEIPLDWSAFDAAAKAGSVGVTKALLEEVQILLETVPEKTKAEGAASLERVKDNPAKLTQLRDWLKSKVVH
jgi:hypothetical protein